MPKEPKPASFRKGYLEHLAEQDLAVAALGEAGETRYLQLAYSCWLRRPS
jgi:hypothetical protein